MFVGGFLIDFIFFRNNEEFTNLHDNLSQVKDMGDFQKEKQEEIESFKKKKNYELSIPSTS